MQLLAPDPRVNVRLLLVKAAHGCCLGPSPQGPGSRSRDVLAARDRSQLRYVRVGFR